MLNRNVFDPFGVLEGWRGQTTEEQSLSESEQITDRVIDEHWAELVDVVQAAVESGMASERASCVELIKKHLNCRDPQVKDLIAEIDSRGNQ